MSTQSNITTLSENMSMTEVNGDDIKSPHDNTEIIDESKGTKATKKGGRSKKAVPKSKRKVSTAQQDEMVGGSSSVQPEDDFEVDSKTVHEKGNKKRKSDTMDIDSDLSTIQVQPQPSKRRATRSSVSRGTRAPISTLEFGLEEGPSVVEILPNSSSPPPPMSKKAQKGGRNRASTTTRKASAASTASKAPLRATAPDDEDIDAALEADLNRPLTDNEINPDSPPVPKAKGRRLTRTRPGSRNATASTAPVRRAIRAGTMPVERDSVVVISGDTTTSDPTQEPTEEVKAVEIALNAVEHAKEEIIAETDKQMTSKTKARKAPPKRAKAAKKNSTTQNNAPAPNESRVEGDEPLTTNRHPQELTNAQHVELPPATDARRSDASTVGATNDGVASMDVSHVASHPSPEENGNETDATSAHAMKGGKKRPAAAKKGKASKKGATTCQKRAEPVQTESDPSEPGRSDVDDIEMVDAQEIVQLPIPSDHAQAEEAPKKQGKAAKPKSGKAITSKDDGMLSPVGTSSFEPLGVAEASPVTMPVQEPTAKIVTPPASQDHGLIEDEKRPVRSSTPKATVLSAQETPKKVDSPQSSDAENQPPSARPSALRPPLAMQSPSKTQTTRFAQTAATPTSSPWKRNVSRLQSALPWTAIDIEKLFVASPAAGKENEPDVGRTLSSPEKKLSVEEWMRWKAARGEEKLREGCERLVGKFEGEGNRALQSLEGIRCAE